MRAWARSMSVAIALGLLACSGAHGKQFRVYTCTDPDERPLGPTIGHPGLASGWEFGASLYFGATLIDDCAAGGRFSVRVHPSGPSTGRSAWARWTAAPGTDLVGVTATWVGYSDLSTNRGEGIVQLTAATDQQTLFAQNSPISVAYGVSGYPPLQGSVHTARWFEFRAACVDTCSTTQDPLALVDVHWVRFDVDDPSPPTGGLVGSATDAQTWSGVVRFGLNAVDVGAGLYRAVVEVDGGDALVLPLGGSGATCADIGPSPDVNEFAAARPCPLRIDGGALDVDAGRLPQGRHVVRVMLEDAAGNRMAIFGPLVRNIAANGAIGPGSDPALRGAANGEGASDQASLTAHWGRRGGRTLLVSPFGRSHVVRGRLRGLDGAPISGAALDIVSKTTAVNARELAKASGPRTRGDGSWFFVLPRGVSSRDLSVRYRSHVNDTIPSASAGVRLRVRAGLRLTIRPRVARRGQAIRFAGRLLGGPLPRGGKQVVLMARASRGAWVRFNVVRTSAHGRFRTTYRFQQPGTARYRFRALSLAEAAYPYLAGGSNVVRVAKR
jgi:hypothetical protein